MKNKNIDNEIMDYFNRTVREANNSLSASIFKERRKLEEEFSNRGTLNSGMAMQAILTMIGNMFEEKLADTLDLIEKFQVKNNIVITSNMLDEIATTYKNSFGVNFLNKVETEYKDAVKKHLGDTLGNSVTNELYINNQYNVLLRKIEESVKNIRTFNNVRQDDQNVKATNRNTRAAIIGGIVAIIGAIVGIIQLFN